MQRLNPVLKACKAGKCVGPLSEDTQSFRTKAKPKPLLKSAPTAISLRKRDRIQTFFMVFTNKEI